LDEVITPSGVLWFAYTQLSFWQAYNKELSSAFRETNYEPELGVSFDTDFSVLGWRHRILSFGFAHQSNGRDEPLSRSWNRLWAGFLFERGNVAVLARPWWRVPESAEKDDNPDIEEYAGRGDIRAAYKHGEHVVSFLWRNNFRWEDNRSGLELDWSFPVGRNLKGLVQYYYGYGESLIDYNVRTNRIGIGLLVADWL
jgi:phospholipase A1